MWNIDLMGLFALTLQNLISLLRLNIDAKPKRMKNNKEASHEA